MSKKKLIMGIVIFAVLIVAYFVIAQQAKFRRVDVAGNEATQKEVACDVSVFNPRGLPLVKNGDLIIESVKCEQQFVRNCGRFGIFSDKGTVRLEAAGGLGSATDVSIGEGSRQSYTLNWCGSKLTREFEVRLFNDENNLLQTRSVKLQ